MTREEIIELAKKADSGFMDGEDADGTMEDSLVGIGAIIRFADLIIFAERPKEGKPIESESVHDLIYRLRERARIRRQIPTRKSVQENRPDRISDLLEEAANVLEQMQTLQEMMR